MKLKKLTDYLIITAGAFVYALSVALFTSPNNIAPGGLTGLGIMLNYLASVPVGAFILAVNVPLFFLGLRKLGKGFIIKTAYGTTAASVLIDVLSAILPGYKGDMMLVCIFGGILSGTGIALIFSRGGSSGGTDIIASLIHSLRPHISVGKIILAFDALIVTLAALVFGSFEAGLYAVISILVSSRLIDVIVYGTSRNNGKLMLIITSRHREITEGLLTGVSRGVTVIDAVGGFSGENRKLLICALRPNQVYKANNLIKACDGNAFVIITTAGTINGLGFVNDY